MNKAQTKKWIAWLLIVGMLFYGQTVPSKTKAKKALQKPVITKVTTTGDGKIKIGYKKTAKGIQCKIQVSTDKKFKKIVQSKTVSGTKKTVTLKKAKKGTYYVRMRSIRIKKKKKQYSVWSSVKKIKISKPKKTIATKKPASAQPKPTQTPSSGQNNNGNSQATPCPTIKNDGSVSNTPDNNNNSGNNNTEDKPIHLKDCSVYINQNSTQRYTGKEQCPTVFVYTADYDLIENVDYTVSYENNINVGTAIIHIRGIGNYYGEVTKTFTISKATQVCEPSFYQQEAVAGKSLPITFEKKVEGTYTCTAYDIQNCEYIKDIQVNSNGEVIIAHSGIFHVSMKIAESQNYYSNQYDLGTIVVCEEDNPEGGFLENIYRGEGIAKTTIAGPIIENGCGSFSISYTSNASDAWLDEHIRFEVENATPTAYTKAFQCLGLDMTTPTVSVENSSEKLRSDYEYNTISGPCVNQVTTYTNTYSTSARKLTITAGIGVRVCKIKAYRDDILYDVVYVATRPLDKDDNELDEALYKTARHKVESKLWTNDMTTLQKLCTLADYISETTHYPGEGCTRKEVNPTFWNAFSVDDIDLFYNMYPMTTLNRIMDLQGGITTCVGITVVEKAAMDDLNLPYLYNSTMNTIADGEGVWLATGSYSSNPSAGNHVSLIYKTNDEKRYFIDAQGLITDSSCETHDCLSKVIRD